MKTYWESENSSLVLAAIVLWLRLYHLQNKCISEPKVGQMFTVFYFKETGINKKPAQADVDEFFTKLDEDRNGEI